MLCGRKNASADWDWGEIVRTAQAEGIAPFLYWQLSETGNISALPKESRDALRVSYSQSWKHNQNIFAELELIAREFARAKIPLVVLKGACFALTIYPDSGARAMSDLDLLVPAAQLNAAVQIAQSLGYADEQPEASPGLRELLSHEICLQKKGARAITLEIHHSLIARQTFKYAVPVDWFWTQTEALNHPRFASLLMLSPTAQLLYASAHAMLQHGGKAAPLRWYVDIDRMIRFYETRIDWDALLTQAKIFEWSSALDAALTQTREYFHTPMPEDARAELARRADRHTALVRNLQRKPLTHTQAEFQKLASLNAHGKIRLLLALVFPSPAYMRWRYGLKTRWALAAYYPLRWWGIITDAVRTLAKMGKKT